MAAALLFWTAATLADGASPALCKAGSTSPVNKLPAVFSDIERRTFDYFLKHTDRKRGLTPDRVPYDEPFASIAAMGFALTAWPIGEHRGWISRAEARQRTLATLQFLYSAPQGDAAAGMTGHRGLYYHFLHLKTGARYGKWVELSSVDTALLLGGVLFAQSWFDRANPEEVQIRKLAEQIYQRVDWSYLQVRSPLIGMGWHPETGMISHDWSGYNEAMLVYILALGSKNHPVDTDAWKAWTRDYSRSWGNFQGESHLSFGPMFGHQYSHVWIDFRGIRDDWSRERDLDYFENSRRATVAQRNYAIANPMGFRGYGPQVWGLTASDGPGHFRMTVKGEQVEVRGYSARGAGLADAFDDGTIAPTAMLGSLPFAPELVIPSVQHLLQAYRKQIYGKLGFLDSFNLSVGPVHPIKYGKVIPDFGWVAHQYIGIDQGPILAMAANYRDGLVWNTMRCNPHIRLGLERAGFRGGWLESAGAADKAGQ